MASKLLCVAASTSQHINAMANGQQQIFIFIQFCIGINCSQKTWKWRNECDSIEK